MPPAIGGAAGVGAAIDTVKDHDPEKGRLRA
jgi:hypothetical protein